MDREQRIKRIVKRYQLISLWIVCGMSLIGFLLVHLGDLTDHIYSVGFCSVYQLVVNRFSIMAWRAIALHSPNIMGRYYMACGTIRMLLALIVVIAGMFFLYDRKDVMLGFVITFALFYISSLMFETMFFSFVEKQKQKRNN